MKHFITFIVHRESMFITFEGLDFSGKSTQARLLVERLKNMPAMKDGERMTVHFVREPGGSKISEQIREILLDRTFPEMTDTAELLLFSASRTQLVKEVIIPALQCGETVVCDRYYDSTTAYQGHGRGLDLEAVQTINRLATAGTDPDLTIFIDIPVEEIERRKHSAGLAFDRMESSGRDFYERVRNGFLEIAAKEAHRFVTIDGMASIENVQRLVWQEVERRLSTFSQ
jgi:dTMP kinase